MSSTRTRVVGTAAAALGLTLVAASALLCPAAATPSGKVTICHATTSATNPYIQITVNTSSIAEANHVSPNGHGTHTGPVFDPQGGQHQAAWGDIIPAFTGTNSFAGLNASGAGSAVLAHGCKVPTAVMTRTPVVAPTVTPSVTPTMTRTETAPETSTTTPSVTPSVRPAVPTTAPTPTGTPKPMPTPTAAAPQTLPSIGGGTTLAHTGASTGLLALLGCCLLGAGAGTLVTDRRRAVLDGDSEV